MRREEKRKSPRTGRLIQQLTLNPLGVLSVFLIVKDFLRTPLECTMIIRLHNASEGTKKLVRRYLDSTRVSSIESVILFILMYWVVLKRI